MAKALSPERQVKAVEVTEKIVDRMVEKDYVDFASFLTVLATEMSDTFKKGVDFFRRYWNLVACNRGLKEVSREEAWYATYEVAKNFGIDLDGYADDVVELRNPNISPVIEYWEGESSLIVVRSTLMGYYIQQLRQCDYRGRWHLPESDWRRVERPLIERIFEQAKMMSLPMLPRHDYNGCDGTTFRLVIENGMSGSSFSWWQDGPDEWHPVVSLASQVKRVLSAVERRNGPIVSLAEVDWRDEEISRGFREDATIGELISEASRLGRGGSILSESVLRERLGLKDYAAKYVFEKVSRNG